MLAANAPSSATLPFMIGMWLNLPVVHAVSPGIGSTFPSTIRPFTYGPFPDAVPCSDRIFCTLSLRRHAAAAPFTSSPQPAASANLEPRCSANSRGATVRNGPLSKIARWNSPALAGDMTRAAVLVDPADWPPTVTLPGSPPNAAMLRCTQRSAACWSISP